MKLVGEYDVVAVGNAIVDVFAHAEDKFLKVHKLGKGGMTLVDRKQAEALCHVVNIEKQQSGGSAANTLASIASMGGKCAFIGKVAEDSQGHVFADDMNQIGVEFKTSKAEEGEHSTARCISLITPDAERTMATYLGVSTELTAEDLDATKIRNAKITYLEGYLFDKDTAKKAFHMAAQMAHDAGKLVALSLSDPFCVDRHRKDFQDLVSGHVDILFCNEQELLNLYETTDFDAALLRVAEHTDVCAVTRGAKGAKLVFHKTQFDIMAAPVKKVEDLTGAGDGFAGGVLYGLTQGMDPVACGNLGAMVASEIISHIGARPQRKLHELLVA